MNLYKFTRGSSSFLSDQHSILYTKMISWIAKCISTCTASYTSAMPLK